MQHKLPSYCIPQLKMLQSNTSLFEHVRLPLGEVKGRGHWGSRSWPEEWEKERDDFRVPLVLSPDKYVVVVAGGDGRHSAWMPAWSTTQRATEII